MPVLERLVLRDFAVQAADADHGDLGLQADEFLDNRFLVANAGRVVTS